VRVIAGSHKGRRLFSSRGLSVRPTSGRVKEAIFSILATHVEGAQFLDLYAGTGAIGIEALSRGAHRVVFVESHPASLRLLRSNVDHCRFSTLADVHACHAEDFLDRQQTSPIVFDIVFADPPYELESASTLLPSLERSVIIAPKTVVLLEHPTKHLVPSHIGRLCRVRHYQYGDTSLSKFAVANAETRLR
jgi:16S rRNA (guanine966-N2)-methyltransferase